MTHLLSDPIESLIANRNTRQFDEQCDVLIVGSGYGGAIAAARLADAHRNVIMFERGNEYAAGEFPESLGDLPGHVRIQRFDRDTLTGRAEGLFDFRIDDPVSVLVGNGLGGGSLINANVALRPSDRVLGSEAWPKALRDDLPALKKGFDAVAALLGVTEQPFEQNRKFNALARLANSMGTTCKPAPIAVTRQDGPNAVGVQQKACIGCGNCVTGCNNGAKNTLAMNALPLAKSRGMRIYTGATVLTVSPKGDTRGTGGWDVRFRRTVVTKSVLHKEVFTLHAKVVILAAGALGSTEILLRSKAAGLACADTLGTNFSTNGDMIAAGYAQKNPVNAVAHADLSKTWDPHTPHDIGPTITGYFQSAVKCKRSELDAGVTIQDGAVPSPLSHLFGEIVTTAQLAKRLINYDPPAWFRDNPDCDPLGVQPGAIGHSQVLLAMGDDGSPWQLRLRRNGDDPDNPDSAAVCLTSADASGNNAIQTRAKLPPVFDGIDNLLCEYAEAGGFDGGDYLPNPMWKLMPEEMAQVSNAPAPGGALLTVHPLGGCVMADDRTGGVVDHHGRVFEPCAAQLSGTYSGLYVMDGAIVPRALGVNPFLTISALAYRNATHVSQYLGWQPCELYGNVSVMIHGQLAAQITRVAAVTLPSHVVEGRLDEVLTGRLHVKTAPPWLNNVIGPHAQRLCEGKGLALTVSTQFTDILKWLRKPNMELDATATLAWNSANTDSIPKEHLHLLASGKGKVRFLAWDKPRPSDVIKRAWQAFWAFFDKRGAELFQDSGGNPWRQLKAFIAVAKNHAHWRFLRYDIELDSLGGKILLSGTKELAYAIGKRNPWKALTELPVRLCDAAEQNVIEGMITVDLVGFSKHSPIQMTNAPNTPVAVMSMISLGAMLLRVLLQSHFWSFGAPTYPKSRLLPAPEDGVVPRLRNAGKLRPAGHEWRMIEPEVITLPVPASAGDKEGISLRLVRYKPDSAHLGPILLVHGQALSSMVFTTATVDVNFAEYLYRQGYDVWLIDYRISVALAGPSGNDWLAANQWTIDQIAENDIPVAVKYVYSNTGGNPIQVFAHCVGAAATCISILGGKCKDPHTGQSMISALATHAVHPWLLPSIANRLRGNLAAFFKNAITWKSLDPLPPDVASVTAFDAVIDRIAGSLPFDGEEDGHALTDKRMGQFICNRMTLFYGYEWRHENLACETHPNLLSLFGITNLEIFRQNFFITQRQRLTNREGANIYVRRQNFREHWQFPTLFAHGAENLVYDANGAAKSYWRLRTLRQNDDAAKPAQVYWFEAPAYGHMDFLFGSNAQTEVYPYIDAFFRQAAGKLKVSDPHWYAALERIQHEPDRDTRDPHWEAPRTPYCGPIIGWVRRSSASAIVRVWIEADTMTTVTPDGIDVSPPLVTVQEVVRLQPPEYPGSYWVYDLTIPDVVNDSVTISFRYPSGSVRARRSDALLKSTAHSANHVLPLDSLPWFRRLRNGESPASCAFLVGSCRYPGSPFERFLADAVFAGMQNHVYGSQGQAGVDHALLIGDQIYADATVDAFDTRELRELFAGRYREAFKADNMRTFLRLVPTYMAVDDHEFEDNWAGTAEHLAAGDKMALDYMERFKHGLAAARAYQWSMTQCDGVATTTAGRHDNGLWHTFVSAGLPYFVMDTRTERTLREANVTPATAELVGSRQLDALCNWLSAADASKPKFIVCSSVLAPVNRTALAQPSLWRNLDGWAGFPATWRKLVQHIVGNNIARVVFVSGDYHISMLAELKLRAAGKSVTAYQIVSSGLYAPLPFANDNAAEYDWGTTRTLPWSDDAARIDFNPCLLSTSTSQFMRVDVNSGVQGWTLEASICDAQGSVQPPVRATAPPFITHARGSVSWEL